MSEDDETASSEAGQNKTTPENTPDSDERTIQLEANLRKDIPRDERILNQISKFGFDGHPKENEQTHVFVAVREAGLRRGIDFTDNLDALVRVVEELCPGYRDIATGLTLDDYFEELDLRDDIVNLNKPSDWNRYKELIDFDDSDHPMQRYGDIVEDIWREEVANEDEP